MFSRINNWEELNIQLSIHDTKVNKTKKLKNERRFFCHTTKTREFSICRVSKSSIFQARKQELVSRGKRPESPTVKNSSCFQKCLMVYNMVLTLKRIKMTNCYFKSVIIVHWTFAFELKSQIEPLWKKPGDTVELLFFSKMPKKLTKMLIQPQKSRKESKKNEVA